MPQTSSVSVLEKVLIIYVFYCLFVVVIEGVSPMAMAGTPSVILLALLTGVTLITIITMWVGSAKKLGQETPIQIKPEGDRKADDLTWLRP